MIGLCWGTEAGVTYSTIWVLSLTHLFDALKKTYTKNLSSILFVLCWRIRPNNLASLLAADVSYMFSDCSLITFLGFCSQTCQYISSTNPINPFPT